MIGRVKFAAFSLALLLAAAAGGFVTNRCSGAREAAALKAAGYARAELVSRVKELEGNLAAERSRLAAVVVSTATLKGSAKEAPAKQKEGRTPPLQVLVAGEATRAEPGLDFADRCRAWQDEHGRFYFDPVARTLEYTVSLRTSTDIIVDRRGRVFARTTVEELSPRTGEVLAIVPAQERARVAVAPPPRWTVNVGYAAGSAGAGPILVVDRALPLYLHAGVIATTGDIAGYIGVAYSW